MRAQVPESMPNYANFVRNLKKKIYGDSQLFYPWHSVFKQNKDVNLNALVELNIWNKI